jgi:hypothetical protein
MCEKLGLEYFKIGEILGIPMSETETLAWKLELEISSLHSWWQP